LDDGHVVFSVVDGSTGTPRSPRILDLASGDSSQLLEDGDVIVAVQAVPARPIPTPELKVAKRYAPVLFFHPDECFFPMDVDDYLDAATLRETVVLGRDPEVEGWNHSGSFLTGDNNRSDFYLDVPGRANDTPESQYCDGYRSTTSPITAYARIFPVGKQVVIQYWLFYYFNPWSGLDHEGDWELVQLVFNDTTLTQLTTDGQKRPDTVGFSQHLFAQAVPFGSTSFEGGLRPWVSVALGSHANSYAPISCSRLVGTDWRLPWLDSVRKDVEVRLITDEPWNNFLGLWGENNTPEPPRSPSGQKPKWDEALVWMGSDSDVCPGPGDGFSVAAQSPVELHVYDDEGRHVGLDEGAQVQSEIPGASYVESEPTHAKMISVGSDDLADSYEVRVQGTGDGNLTLSVQIVDDAGAEYAALYESVPVTAATVGRLQVFGRRVASLEIDQDGDGDFESTVAPETFGAPDDAAAPSDASGSGPSVILLAAGAAGLLVLAAGLVAGVWYFRKQRPGYTR